MTHSVSIRPAHRHLWSGLTSDDPDAEVGVLGVPFDNATSFRKGASFAPARIREMTPHVAASTEEGFRLAGLRVRDYGDVSADRNWERYFATVEAQAAQAPSFCSVFGRRSFRHYPFGQRFQQGGEQPVRRRPF